MHDTFTTTVWKTKCTLCTSIGIKRVSSSKCHLLYKSRGFVSCRSGALRCLLTQCEGGRASTVVLEKQWAAAHQPAKVIHLWSSEKDYSQLKNSQQNIPVISTQGLISKKQNKNKTNKKHDSTAWGGFGQSLQSPQPKSPSPRHGAWQLIRSVCYAAFNFL